MKSEEIGSLPYETDIEFSGFSSDIKPIALYLPQFHEIPENNEWWGEGFTEWSNVKKAKPIFEGHYQPKVPHDDIGYYDLTDIKNLEKQAKLARKHGIYAFGVYYYWFSGKRLLERPIDLLLNHPEVDFPFFLIWANENWTRTWDGLISSILMKQKYESDDPAKFITDIKKYVNDPRYMRVDGKPVIGIYNLKEVPHPEKVLTLWRDLAQKLGIGEILIWSCRTDHESASLAIMSGVDAEYEFPPRGKSYVHHENINNNGIIWDYKNLVEIEQVYKKDTNAHPIYRGSMLSWDNSPRKNKGFHIWNRYSHKDFYIWNRIIVNYTRQNFSPENRFIFVNAWNEWGEGTYLEPDKKYGYAAINALSKAIYDLPYDESTPAFITGGYNKQGDWDETITHNPKISMQVQLWKIAKKCHEVSNQLFPPESSVRYLAKKIKKLISKK